MVRYLIVCLITIQISQLSHSFLLANTDDVWTEEKLLKLMNEVISHRNKIQTYDVTVKLEKEGNKKIIYKNIYRNRKENDKLYFEHDSGLGKTIIIQNGDYQGYTFHYQSTKDLQVNSGHYTKKSPDNLNKDSFNYFNFLKIGLVPIEDPVFKLFSLSIDDAFIYLHEKGKFDVTFNVSKTKLNEQECLLITAEDLTPDDNPKKKGKTQIWIDLNQGPSIVRYENRIKDMHRILQNKNEKHEPSGIWFPVYSEYIFTKGNQTINNERREIIIHSLNTPIDPKLFQVSGIGLPPGAQIFDELVSKSPVVINDKNELVSPDAFGTPEPEPKERSKWWGRAAIITAVLTLIVGVIYLRKRRLQNS